MPSPKKNRGTTKKIIRKSAGSKVPLSQQVTGRKKIGFKSADIALDALLLDPNNYRFLDNPNYKKKIKTRFHDEAVQEATLRILEKNKQYQLDELKKSILTNGYVPMERIIVVPYEHRANKFLVVEGNRRVAALKSLVLEANEGVRDITEEERASFSTIPCAILQAPAGGLKHAERVIMGIRHIAGPKEWGAYQQAQLVTELHDDEGEDFTSIGEHLGISTVEVARRYRAMRALKVMENDELFASSASPHFYRLFHELVSLPEVRKRFGWNDSENTFIDTERAREFFELIAPQDGEEAKLKTYSDVRRLKLIVHRPKAEAALLDPDKTLSDALRLADAEIADEATGRLSVGQLCAEMRSKLQKISMSDLENITKADVKKIDGLATAASHLQEMAKQTFEKDDDDAASGD